jgi:transposase
LNSSLGNKPEFRIDKTRVVLLKKKKYMSKIIGIDISKETFDVVILREDESKDWYKFENKPSGFKDLLKLLKAGDKCIMEATGPYYHRLAYYLHEKLILVSVVNPLKIKRFCQMRMQRAKTDKKDAFLIAEYGKSENPGLWSPEPQAIQQLKQKNTALDLFEKHTTSLSNQLEALRQLNTQDTQTIKVLKELLHHYEKRIAQLEAEMDKIIKQNYKQTYESIISIPGIGNKTGIALICITNNFQKFDNYKQLISYVGMSPRIFESGSSVKGKGRICKMGMGRIRKLLYICAWSAKRYNRFCMEFYNRLKSKGKPERVIKIAIANKLLKQVYAIVTNQTYFDKNFKNSFVF